MDAQAVTILVGLGGILLGGGLKAVEMWLARRSEADAVLSALVAEVEALTRLIGFREYLQAHLKECDAYEEMIAQGHGDDVVPSMRAVMNHDYFALFNALADKIGLLNPYHADRIVRFYAFAKAATEHLLEAIPAMPAAEKLRFVRSDAELLHVLLALGEEISRFRMIVAPATATGPTAAPEAP